MISRLLARAVLLVLSVMVSLVTIELVLRTWPRLLSDAFANGALSKYTAGSPRGIYYQDHALDIHFMIPNHRTTMYYNRYVWEHETDSYGFRNRDVRPPADVMLLGDSYTYGHGVDYAYTISHILHQLTGLTVANLARQGDCSLQQVLIEAVKQSGFARGLTRERLHFDSFEYAPDALAKMRQADQPRT